jgi:glycosyltransferase involved in cell wall biosynthesis
MTEAELSVLPNGVDTDLWRPDREARADLRREMGLGDAFLWLAAGRLEPVKDYPTLLRAFAQTPETALLAIAGSGPLRGELEGLAAHLGLERRVRFLGFEANLRPWMQAADGFVLSSQWEGLPMGVLEAAACALPAVATDVPGTREAIENGRTGWLTPAGDAVRLGDAMTRFQQASWPERAAMGGQARHFILDRFGLESVLDRWEAFYNELLALNPEPRRWSRRDDGAPVRCGPGGVS